MAKEEVVGLADVSLLYEVPLVLNKEGLGDIVIKNLGLPQRHSDLAEWSQMIDEIRKANKEVTVAIVGKYIELEDSYLSIVEALKHGGIPHHVKVLFKWINAEKLEEMDDIEPVFRQVQGILIPGGFGGRGIEGKIRAIRYARENGIPFLGLCLGMQCAVIEFARNVCKLKGANSSEFDPETKYPVIDFIPEQKTITEKGGTMRLGAYPCRIKKGTLLHQAYGRDEVQERHRHRYEFNNEFRQEFEGAGMVLSGINPDADLVEVVEYPAHPWFVGTQYHPEFKSRPNRPHPLFAGFVGAAKKRLDEQVALFKAEEKR